MSDLTVEQLWKNWGYVAAGFGITSSGVVMLQSVSSALIDPKLGGDGNGLLNLMWFFSSTFLGNRCVNRFGAKWTMLFGVIGYDILLIIFSFFAATNQSETKSILLMIAYGIAGIGAGLLWTGQGDYFALNTAAIATTSGEPPSSFSIQMAAVFASWNLGAEVAIKLLVALLQSFDLPFFVPVGGAALLALGFTVFLVVAPVNLESKQASKGKDLDRMIALWKRPELWLLAFLNLTFAGMAGFLNNFIGGQLGRQTDPSFVLICSAGLSLLATAVQFPQAKVVERFGKGAGLGLGSFWFCVMAILGTFLPIGSLGRGLAIFYALQALGRAAFESTNRAVFADFFPPPDSVEAFANVSLQQAFAFTVSFFTVSRLSPQIVGPVGFLLAAAIVPGYLVAHSIRRRKEMMAPTEGA